MSDSMKLWLGVVLVFGACWLGAAVGIFSGGATPADPVKKRGELAANDPQEQKKNSGEAAEADDVVHDFFRNPSAYEEKEVTLTARIVPAEADRPDALLEDRLQPFSGKKASLFCLVKGQKIEAIAYVPQTLAIPKELFPNDHAIITFQCGLGKADNGNLVTSLKVLDAK